MAKRLGAKKLMLNLAIIVLISIKDFTQQIKIQDVKNVIGDDVELQASISDLASIFKNQVQQNYIKKSDKQDQIIKQQGKEIIQKNKDSDVKPKILNQVQIKNEIKIDQLNEAEQKVKVKEQIKDEKSQETQKPPPFEGYIQIKKILSETDKTQFIEQILSRKDGLNHLLLSDSDNLLMSFQNDFPDIAKVISIGKSFEGRDINVLQIDYNQPIQNDVVPISFDNVVKVIQVDGHSIETKDFDDFVQTKQNLLQINSKIRMRQRKDEELNLDFLEQVDTQKNKTPVTTGLGHQKLSDTKVMGGKKPAILITGATHARELISTTLTLYQLLKLVQYGYIYQDSKYKNLLAQNKYYFMPIFNVDGMAQIEDNWINNKKILSKRKNSDTSFGQCMGMGQDQETDVGVDLNRNFGVDFGQVDSILNYQMDVQLEKKADRNRAGNPCSTNFPGIKAFSEPETVAFKNFLTAQKSEMAFVINIHSNGNAFIYPFNGRQKNDIEQRRPGILQIFTQISNEAPFPLGTMKGTSKEVMGQAIGGDQDDWTLGELGIPSVTAEVGFVGQFIDEWRVKDEKTANDIVEEQSAWIEYIYDHLPEYGEIVYDHQK